MEFFLLFITICAVIIVGVLIQKLTLARRRVADAMHREADIKNFLNIFSQNIKDLDDVDRAMMLVARHVADLCDAQAVCIYKLEEDQHLRMQGYCGAYPPMLRMSLSGIVKPKYILDTLRRERIPLGHGIIGSVAALLEPIFLEDASNDTRLEDAQMIVPIETLMAVPLINNGRLEGVICAINTKLNNRAFTQEQFSRFKFISKQILIALNIMNAYTSLAKQERISQELHFARALQASMLPSDFPSWKQFDLFQMSRPAKEVSGDFYDFVPIDEDRLLAVVVDVCGKGIPACMVMSMTRTFIHAYAPRFVSMHDFLTELNDNLYRDTEAAMYATMACCLINAKENTVEIARAGHTGIFFHIRNHHRMIFPDGPGLGLMPSSIAEFETITLNFTGEMSILMFTDGFSEATNENDEEFGVEKISEIFNEACLAHTLDTFGEHILHLLDNFTGNAFDNQADDQTFVLIHHQENDIKPKE